MAMEAEWARRASAGLPGLVGRGRTPGSTALLLGCVGPHTARSAPGQQQRRLDGQRRCLRYDVLAQLSWSVPCQAMVVTACPAQLLVPGARADLVAWVPPWAVAGLGRASLTPHPVQMSLKLVTTAVSGLRVPAPVALPVETALLPSTPNPDAPSLLNPPPASPSEGLHPSLVPESFCPDNLPGEMRAPHSWRETPFFFSISEPHPGPWLPCLACPGGCRCVWD